MASGVQGVQMSDYATAKFKEDEKIVPEQIMFNKEYKQNKDKSITINSSQNSFDENMNGF